jgi:hypothetical protein
MRDRLKDLARRGSDCSAYQVHRAALIFATTRNPKHPRGNRKMILKTGSVHYFLNRDVYCSLRSTEELSKMVRERLNRNVAEE